MACRYSVIIPAYNEARNIKRAVKETVRVFSSVGETFEVLVVDDGSRDATPVLVEALMRTNTSVRLLRQSVNQGKGAAVQLGVRKATGAVLLFLDADLATHPNEFLKALKVLGTCDIALGSRRVPGARIATPQPWYRTIVGRLFNLVVRGLFGFSYRDTQCGFKVFTRKAARAIFPEMTTRGWVFDVELLVRARAHGFRVGEFPVTWHNGRDTRVRLTDAWSIARDLLRLRVMG